MKNIGYKTDSSQHGLIIEPRDPRDYILGASKVKREILKGDGQWDEYLPVAELQRNKKGDVFGCVSFASNNVDEILHKYKYKHEININDRILVVGSGTTPYVGNSTKRVEEWKRKNGFVIGESKWEYTDEMTVEEYYNNGTVPQELLNKAKKTLEVYEIGYEWVPLAGWGRPFSTPLQMMNALKYSPLALSVDGIYEYNSNGLIGQRDRVYTHQLVCYGYEENKYWKIFDSESEKPLKFEWNYQFGFPMNKFLEKKNMKLFRQKGKKAIYFYNKEDGTLAPFTTGVLEGGSVFKALGLSYDMASVVDELPYPIAPYAITTVGYKPLEVNS